jgi:beta-lactam-binding protein with PASTA domain
VATIAGIICIVLAIVGIGYFLYSYFLSDLMKKTAEDTVPNFVGMNMSDIDETKYPNFALDYSNQQASDQYPSGYIIAQSPDADSTAKVGTTIKLTVSTGPETNTMPDLVNKSEASAKSYLDKMAIQVVVSVSYEQNDDYTDGYVIRTDPEANASLTAGQTVTLFVCQKSDEEMVPVPALVGMDVDDALALIDSSNLGRGDVRSIESDLPEGTVTFQSIDEGEKVKSGTTINLQVSKGPEEAAAPVVKYLTGNSTVQVGDTLTLQIQANTTDEGVLTYAWYVSKTGSTDDGQVVSASAEGNTTCTVDTSAAGSSYYFCKITNTLGKATATTYSNMVYVTVEAKQASTLKDKVLAVEMPSSDGVYDVTVKVGGVQQQNFEVDMSQVEGTVISIQVSGTGSQVVDVYVDGQLQSTQTVDFGS